MPSAVLGRDEPVKAVEKIVRSSPEDGYVDQVAFAIKEAEQSNRTLQLVQSLSQLADEREADIQRMCNSHHQEFVTSVDHLLRTREGMVALTSEILNLNQKIQISTEKLAEQKKALVDARGVRHNIDEATQSLKDCLEVLRLANHVHELRDKKNYYAALTALAELQNVHLKEITNYKIAELIQKSVPATQRDVAKDVVRELNEWLHKIRETSQFIGELAFYHTSLRKARHEERMEKLASSAQFKLNSAIELVSDETEDFDVLDNDEVQVDFTPLFDCVHIHEELSQIDKFRLEYAMTRNEQKKLLLRIPVDLTEVNQTSLSGLLESIAGFAIIERATQKRANGLRSPSDVEDLWDSMCRSAVNVMSEALNRVDSAESLLKIKGLIALFIQTMDVRTSGWDYSVEALDSFLLNLFEKYAELLKKKCSDEFQAIVLADDYMPMPINDLEEYDKLVHVSWYDPGKGREELDFPCVLPFSQMYPLCCIEIRNFLNQFYFFSDDHFEHSSIIDETLRKSLDELLLEKICEPLVERLQTQYLGQIVQILINLEHFETACEELEQLLIAARSSTSSHGPITFNATEAFRSHKKTAEKRIFEVVNSKIDALIETADYNWMAYRSHTEPSNYMQELTRYLSDIMSSTLLGLPTDISRLIYFDALSHAASRIEALPLSDDVKRINVNGANALAVDVSYLTDFILSLNDKILLETFEGLQQTVNLLKAGKDAQAEFQDPVIGNKKYNRITLDQASKLWGKIVDPLQSHTTMDKLTNLSSRFGMK